MTDATEALETVLDGDEEIPEADGADGADGPVDDGGDVDVDDGGGRSNGVDELKKRLRSTEPNMDLADPSLDDVVDVENGGFPRIKRGLYKAIGLEGATAAEDLLRGGVEEAMKRRSDGSSDGGDDGGDDGEVPEI